MNTLFLLAHHDDEYFSSLLMGMELRSGNHPVVIYLTHGSVYGVASEIRMSESLRVLIRMGVNPANIYQLGHAVNIFDQELPEQIEEAYEHLCRYRSQFMPIGRVYVMAWEGGHPDHDACHLIGVALAHAMGLQNQLYEFPAYHAVESQLMASGVMQFRDGNRNTLTTDSTRKDAFRAFCLSLGYPSQWSTFLALLPGSAVQLLLRGQQIYRPVPAGRNYAVPPHEGTLFYEKRFHFSFERFLELTKPFHGNI